MSGVTAGTVAAVAATASAAVSIGTGIAGATGGNDPSQAAPGQYIKPTVTAAQANAANAKILAAINRSIRQNNKYQRVLERARHSQVREDIQWFRDQRESAVGLADPYVKERAAYIDKMRALMDDPTSFLQKSPEYRARMAGGLEALTSQLAAKGLIGSGNVAIEAQALGAREASGQLGKDWERLAKLSGLMDANLGAAADIQSGARTPAGQEYNPRFEQQQFHPAAFEQGQQLQPGQLIPNQTRAYAGDIAGGLGGLAGVYYDYQRRQGALGGGGGGGYTNDQGAPVSY